MPTREIVQKALSAIKRSVDNAYFFDHLKSPEWIKPLWEEGFFRAPFEPIREGESIRFPFWPESRYLARMSKLAPTQVLEVALQIPHTENVRVYEDLVDVASDMPAQLAVKLVPKITVGLASPYQFHLPIKIGALITHLSRGGKTKEALDLAKSLLALSPDPRATEENGSPPMLPSSLEPRAHFDGWQYEQILKNDMPMLVKMAGEPALLLLCDLLSDAVRFSLENPEEGAQDYSYMWRPAIEEHEQNHRRHGIRESLVSAVRDSTEQLVTSNIVAVDHLIRILEERHWSIFQRLALHILRSFPSAAPELVKERLTSYENFDNVRIRHEYFLLATDYFSRLSTSDQNKILSWIEKGPDIGRFIAREKQQTGELPSEDTIVHYTNLWQRDKLTFFSASLPVAWRQHYEELLAELGKPEHPEFPLYISGFRWASPESSKNTEDLRSLSIDSLITYLETWQPSYDPFVSSRDDLVAELTSLISVNPTYYISDAERFLGLDPAYVRAFIAGLHEAAKNQRVFSWDLALEFCKQIITTQEDVLQQVGASSDYSSMFSWTRQTIIDLLTVGFEISLIQIPFALRSEVWKVLHPITNDPDPTSVYEAMYGDPNMDPSTLSINTTRGKAIHTVIRYALWIRRQHEDGGEQVRVSDGFDEMPEVREILEYHLDPTIDPSLAVRSVYGRWFPWLVLLDKQWAKRNTHRIFPIDDEYQNLRKAAWEAYIVFCEPYNNSFSLLRKEYACAIDSTSVATEDRHVLANPNERLAQHLMSFYWRGKLRLDQPEGLLARFYIRASDELRGQALSSIGWALYHMEESLSKPIIRRLKALWSWRFAVAQNATSISHSAELAAFGLWFASAKFDDDWSFFYLKEVLKLTGELDQEPLVLERLDILAQERPVDVIACLALMVEKSKEDWHIRVWDNHLRSILTTILITIDIPAKEAAVSLINQLGARGYLSFRSLLKQE